MKESINKLQLFKISNSDMYKTENVYRQIPL